MQPDTTLPKEPKVKVYTALLTQTGSDAPSSVILHNTYGSLPITRDSTGEYNITGDFPLNKTYFTVTNNAGDTSVYQKSAEWIDSSTLRVRTNINGTPTDGILLNTPIEIRIYE